MTTEALLIEQCGQYLLVGEEVIQRIGDISGRCLVTTDDPRHGSVVQKETKSLLRSVDGSRLPTAGLFPAYQFQAWQNGISLRRRITPAIVSLPAPRQLEFLRYPQVAHFVRQTPLGRIGVHPGIKPEHVIADLSVAFPGERIIVLGEHIRQLKGVRHKLHARGIHAECATGRFPLTVLGDSEEALPQVVCSTPREAANLDFATASIVILLDASTCQHASMQLTLTQVDAAFRLYGLVDATRGFAPSAIDSMMATFGPDLLSLHSEGRVRRDVQVAWVSTPPPTVDVTVTDPGFGLRCYWHHERRNRRIKHLALSLRSAAPLNRDTHGDVARVYCQSRYSAPRVTVLVERPIHAAELSRMLPDWPVVASDDALEGLDGEFCDSVRQSRQRWSDGSQQIVVASSAKRFRGDTSDVVIWAGGGRGIEAIPLSWLSAEGIPSKPLLIVDFQDHHNEAARQLSRQRQRAYLQNDMFPVGVSAAQGRVVVFLDRRPRRTR